MIYVLKIYHILNYNHCVFTGTGEYSRTSGEIEFILYNTNKALKLI